jgi:hypothetical protein
LRRCDVADEIEFEIFVERSVDRVRRSDTEERVAVRGRAHDRLGRDSAAGARPVLDDDLLTEPLRQPLTDQADGNVRPATGRKADDPVHRTCRVDLPPSDARGDRDRGGTRCQMQELATRKSQVMLRELERLCPDAAAPANRCRFSFEMLAPPGAHPLPLNLRNAGIVPLAALRRSYTISLRVWRA